MEDWNGAAWTLAVSPNAGIDSVLDDVMCTSSSQCWAVGSTFDGSTAHTFVLQWNGVAWVIVASPNSSLTQNNELEKVSCISSSDCWTVGSFLNDSNTLARTLALHWDGSSWPLVSTPTPDSSQHNALSGIASPSPSAYWAVGKVQALAMTI